MKLGHFGRFFAHPTQIPLNPWPKGQILGKKVWPVTVIVRTFFRYYSMSDIFGLAYLVGQIED
jgi:hypothetical protein